MKKVLLAVCAFVVAVCSCSKLNELDSKVGELDSRVTSLEKKCETINTNISAIQAMVNALNQKKFIETVEETAGGVKITFSDGQVVAVRNGENGGKGDKGDAPVISVKLYEGVYYWTVDGEWMLNEKGEKVSAVGVTPLLKIEDKQWKVSYDEGQTWTAIAPAYDPEKYITVTQDEDNVYFTLPDQTVITIPKVPGFKFKVLDVDDIAMEPGEVRQIPYTIAKGDETVRFVVAGENYGAKVIPSSVAGGVVEVTAPNPIVEGYLLITAVQNSTGESKAQYLSFGPGKAVIITPAKEAETIGGEFAIDMKVNCDFAVDIPAEAQSWISLVSGTKALVDTTVTFLLQPNFTQAPRQSTVTITPATGAPVQYTISQKGEKLDPVFNVDTTPIVLTYKETTATVKVTGTVLWTVVLSDPAMSASKLSGAGPADIEITLPKNTKQEVANYSVTVSSDEQSLETKEYVVPISQSAAPDPNDYYALFQAGEDIEINGEVFNNTKYPVAARLKKAYEMETDDASELIADATAKGILFLDFDPEDKKTDSFTTANNIYMVGTTIIIGRYKNHQPVINAKSFAPSGTKVVLKNVGVLTSSNTFVTSKCTSNLSVSIEDCTLNSGFYHIFSECTKGVCFDEIKINNSVLSATKGLIGWATYSSGDTINTGLVSMTNSVFYGKSLITYPTVAFRVSSTSYVLTPNLDVNFDHCTLYNVNNYNYGIYALQNAKKINYNYNVSEAALTKASPVVMLPAALDPKISGSTVNYNYGNNSADNAFAWSYGYSTTLNSGVTQTGNTWAKGASPFSSVDVTTGYFPVNTTVVTNGAGASYETKLWNTWTK